MPRILSRGVGVLRPRKAVRSHGRHVCAGLRRHRRTALEALEDRTLLSVVLGSGVGLVGAEDGAGDPAGYPFSETFDDSPSVPPPHWTFSSTGNGRIELVEDAADTVLRMDAVGGFGTNEAVLTIDLAGRSGVRLFFLEQNVDDEAFPEEDGLFVRSNDAQPWTKIHDLSNQAADWQTVVVDLDQAVQNAGLAYTDRFQIKFQQHDNDSWPQDGRQFDDIRVTWEGDGPAITSYGALSSLAPLQLDGFQFVFDEAILPESFGVDDVLAFTGPGGADLRGQLTGVTGSGATFTVQFAAQTAPGVYEMLLGPNILDVAGNPLDQDGDGLVGEAAEDVFFISYSLAVPASLRYVEDFSAGLPAEAWTFYSSEGGRIQVADGELRMDSDSDRTSWSLNEAILHLNLAGRSGILLEVDHINAGDEDHHDNLAEEQLYVEPHRNADMISISDDGGATWFVVKLLSDSGHVTIDLDSAVVTGGMQYTDDFLVKFQQYDNVSWGSDGRGFDNVVVASRQSVQLELSSPAGFVVGVGERVPVTVRAAGTTDALVAFQLSFGGSEVELGELHLENWTTEPVWTTELDGMLDTPDDVFVSAEVAPPGAVAAPVTLGSFDLVTPTAPGSYLLSLEDPAAGPLATRIEGLSGPLDIGSFGDVTVIVLPPAASQVVWASGTVAGEHAAYAPVGMDFGFTVRYTTSDGNASLGGLGLRVHFDSTVMTFDSATEVFADGLTAPPQVFADAEDFDGDPSTDQYVQVVWTDSAGGGWPGEPLPVELLTARFVTAADGALVSTASPIRFTASSTAEGYAFESTPLEVKVTPNLDVDGNATADALTDGVVILRYLFGFTGTALVEDAIDPSGSRTESAEIAQFLEGGGDSMADVDGNGVADALTDGVVMLRYLFGFTGTALVEDAIDPSGRRTDPAEIAAFLDHFNPNRAPITALSVDAVDEGPAHARTAAKSIGARDAVLASDADALRPSIADRALWWDDNWPFVARRPQRTKAPKTAVDQLLAKYWQ